MSDSHAPAHAADSYRWTILAVVTGGQSLAALVGLSLLPLAPFVQAEFAISRVQVGLLISALYVGALVSAVPFGWLTDAIGSRLVLVLSQAVVGGGIVLLSLSGSYGYALAVMPLVGIGYGGINPMSSKAIMAWFPGPIRGTAMGIKQTGFALGGALGALTLPALALAFGWRTALLLGGLGMVVSALAGGWLFREPSASTLQRSAVVSLRGIYGRLVRDRDLMVVVAIGVPLATVQLTVTGYLVLFLAEMLRLPIVLAGAMLSVAQLSGVLARVGWGVFSDRVTEGRRRPALVAVTLVAAVAAGLTSLLGPEAPLWAVAVCAFLLGASAIGWNGVYATLIGEMAGGASVAGATGLSTAANFLGVILGPPLFGLAVDLSGSYALAWRLVAGVSLVNLGALLLVRERSAR